MPERPLGEANLRGLAHRFELAESQIRELIAEAVVSNGRRRVRAVYEDGRAIGYHNAERPRNAPLSRFWASIPPGRPPRPYARLETPLNAAGLAGGLP
jgi:hypothetical protein